MLHKNSRERYDKLKKVFRRLMQDFNRDNLDDFIATANSLPEWIEQDSAMTDEQKNEAERFTIPNGVDWQICNEIANRQKHFGGRREQRFVRSVVIKTGGQGFVLESKMQVVGAGEEIIVECDGMRTSALAFVIRTFRHFHYIFEVAPIPLSERNFSGLSDIFR